MSTLKSKKKLRKLELESYSNIVATFIAQGELTDEKNNLLKELRAFLRISTDRHKAEIRRSLCDNSLLDVSNAFKIFKSLDHSKRFIPVLFDSHIEDNFKRTIADYVSLKSKSISEIRFNQETEINKTDNINKSIKLSNSLFKSDSEIIFNQSEQKEISKKPIFHENQDQSVSEILKKKYQSRSKINSAFDSEGSFNSSTKHSFLKRLLNKHQLKRKIISNFCYNSNSNKTNELFGGETINKEKALKSCNSTNTLNYLFSDDKIYRSPLINCVVSDIHNISNQNAFKNNFISLNGIVNVQNNISPNVSNQQQLNTKNINTNTIVKLNSVPFSLNKTIHKTTETIFMTTASKNDSTLNYKSLTKDNNNLTANLQMKPVFLQNSKQKLIIIPTPNMNNSLSSTKV